MKLFCGHEREAVLKIKAHLVAENRACTRSRAIIFIDSMEKNISHQVFILMFNKHSESSKTKIVVLKAKELIYTAIFIALGILFIVLLIFMFAPKNKKTQQSSEASLYTPGVYTSSLSLNSQAVDVEVVVDETSIKSVRLVNLADSVAAMYPLVEPAMENLSEQIVENQSLSGLSYDESSQYTSMALAEAIGNALEKARTAE